MKSQRPHHLGRDFGRQCLKGRVWAVSGGVHAQVQRDRALHVIRPPVCALIPLNQRLQLLLHQGTTTRITCNLHPQRQPSSAHSGDSRVRSPKSAACAPPPQARPPSVLPTTASKPPRPWPGTPRPPPWRRTSPPGPGRAGRAGSALRADVRGEVHANAVAQYHGFSQQGTALPRGQSTTQLSPTRNCVLAYAHMMS